MKKNAFIVLGVTYKLPFAQPRKLVNTTKPTLTGIKDLEFFLKILNPGCIHNEIMNNEIKMNHITQKPLIATIPGSSVIKSTRRLWISFLVSMSALGRKRTFRSQSGNKVSDYSLKSTNLTVGLSIEPVKSNE